MRVKLGKSSDGMVAVSIFNEFSMFPMQYWIRKEQWEDLHNIKYSTLEKKIHDLLIDNYIEYAMIK